MLLWHSVGTGKTATAIGVASTSFEPDYTILWVTRSSLKNDIWKNMFDQVAHAGLQKKMADEGFTMPTEQSERMRLLSPSWSIRPMSYKQFTNIVAGKNQLYKDLVKKNGEEDPLRKTLLIIDEAHKLYGGNDMSSIERPDMKKLREALFRSYEVSGKDSVRLLLMTATPYTNDPFELVKLLNLLRLPTDQLPDDYDEFAEAYFRKDEATFSKKGKFKYLNQISGYVSFLSRERDARQFAQPKVRPVVVDETIPAEMPDDMTSKNIAELQADMKGRVEEKAEMKETRESIREKSDECKKMSPAEKKEYNEEVKLMREELANRIQTMKLEDETDKAVLKKLKAEMKKNLKDFKAANEFAQTTVIEVSCAKDKGKGTGKGKK
jgi:hypothetical protein